VPVCLLKGICFDTAWITWPVMRVLGRRLMTT